MIQFPKKSLFDIRESGVPPVASPMQPLLFEPKGETDMAKVASGNKARLKRLIEDAQSHLDNEDIDRAQQSLEDAMKIASKHEG